MQFSNFIYCLKLCFGFQNTCTWAVVTAEIASTNTHHSIVDHYNWNVIGFMLDLMNCTYYNYLQPPRNTHTDYLTEQLRTNLLCRDVCSSYIFHVLNSTWVADTTRCTSCNHYAAFNCQQLRTSWPPTLATELSRNFLVAFTICTWWLECSIINWGQIVTLKFTFICRDPFHLWRFAKGSWLLLEVCWLFTEVMKRAWLNCACTIMKNNLLQGDIQATLWCINNNKLSNHYNLFSVSNVSVCVCV